MNQVKILDLKFSSILEKEVISASIYYKGYYYNIYYNICQELKTISRVSSYERILRPIIKTYYANNLTEDIPGLEDYKFILDVFDKSYKLKVFL